MKNFTMYIYKKDKRVKKGERIVSITVWKNRDEAEMHSEVRELQNEKYPVSAGYRILFF
jgi:heme-degrading monooxygenase HmoA